MVVAKAQIPSSKAFIGVMKLYTEYKNVFVQITVLFYVIWSNTMTLSTRQSHLFPQPWEGYTESIVNRGMWLRTRETEGRAAVRWIKLLNSVTVGLHRLTKSLTCVSQGKDEKRTQNFSTKNLKKERLDIDGRIRD